MHKQKLLMLDWNVPL